MTKPFGTLELLARIRTALRHTRTTAESDEIGLSGTYHVGGLEIDYKKNGTFIEISYKNNHEKDTYIEVPLFNYLGYKAEGAKLVNGENNLIRLLVDNESGKIKVYYGMTKIQKVSYIISFISTLGFIGYIIIEKRKK